MREEVDWEALLCINLKEAPVMDDTDTSHLQSPDATLPTSSLANDLKIPLTYSKGLNQSWAALCRVHRKTNLEEKGVGRTEMYGYILKIHFCFLDTICFQDQRQDFIMLYQSCED